MACFTTLSPNAHATIMAALPLSIIVVGNNMTSSECVQTCQHLQIIERSLLSQRSLETGLCFLLFSALVGDGKM